MKVAISLISSLLIGVMVKDVVDNRRRLIASILLGCTGFIFLMAGTLLGSVNLAMQYDAQEFVLWNTILGLASIFAGVGVLCALTAKWIFPKPNIARTFASVMDPKALSGLMGVVTQFSEGMRVAAQGFNPGPTPPPPAPSSPTQTPFYTDELSKESQHQQSVVAN